MAKVKLEQGENEYVLIVDGQESEAVEYGDSVELDGHIAHLDKDENGEIISCFSAWVMKFTPLPDSAVEIEDVDFDEEDTVEVDAE